ncbi:NB-ARC domain-containing protein [Streptomyces sp. NRRL F-525]|uniref:WD40 domain-containing protein n=1 Tax=Streptomyces sp. NRRL F-525 TaxID=1463861 RepID=UPI0005267DE0|nr:NB-ARC domain-containing protein [Streptomyces sp. NRRL F-525]
MTELAELTECLGDETAAQALLRWADETGKKVAPLRPRWKPSGKGYTGATLTAVTVTGAGTVVVKLCPADQRAEPAAHERALRASRLRGDFATRHLTEPAFPPYPVGDGRLLTFQRPAGGSLRDVVTMAHLGGEDLLSVFRVVVTGLVTDWNAGVENREAQEVPVSRFLRDELGGSVEADGEVRAYAVQVGAFPLDPARPGWMEIDGVVLPNPLLMALGDRRLVDPLFQVVHGVAHSDLHLQNVMVPSPRGTLRPDAYRFIDLADFAETAPLTRDVAMLMLSVLAGVPADLDAPQELALLSHVVNPRDVHVRHLVPWVRELVDGVHAACADVVPDGWADLWSDQLLLSVQATALRFTTYTNLSDAHRWRYFRLAAHAGGELLARHGVTPPPSGPGIVRLTSTGAVADRPPCGPVATGQPPHMAPPVPSDFVERPEQGDRVVRSLLAAAEAAAGNAGAPAAVGLTSTVTGVHGTGGFGKTTLAAWACRHPDVLAAFPDGVLWVQLGQDASQQGISTVARDLVRLLTGAEPPGYATAEAAGVALGAALDGRHVLLVVDDVWRREDLEPFLRGGSGCVRLVTTRSRGLLDRSAPLVHVDRMSFAQSLSLLTAGIVGADNTTVLPLAERSGNWPLALRLFNGVLRSMVQRSGMGLAEVVSTMAGELDRRGLLDPIHTDPDPHTRTMGVTVDLSLVELARIPDTGVDSVARLLATACFPEDQHIPYRWLARLWGVSELTARQECLRLDDHSLLAQLDAEGIRLHDVIRAILRRREPRTVRQAHRTLLDVHAPLCGGAGWHALAGPDADPEFLDQVTYHLAEAEDGVGLDRTTTDLRFLVERLWRSGPTALEAEAARRRRVLLPLGMDGFATELASLVYGEAHLLTGHARRVDLAVTLYSRCVASEKLMRRLHHTHDVLVGGLIAKAPFPDGPDGRLWRVLTGHTGVVHALCWRPDGRLLATGGDDGTVRIRWIDEDGIPDLVVETAGKGQSPGVDAAAGPPAVVALSWSPDVVFLAVGTDRGDVLLVDPSQGRVVRRLTIGDDDRPQVQVAFAPDSRAVAVACGRDVRLWHAPFTAESLGPPLPGRSDATCTVLGWHARGGLAVGLGDGRVRLWRDAEETEPVALDTGQSVVQALDWHPDGNLLAVAGNSATVTLIDCAGADAVARVFGEDLGRTTWLRSLAWTGSGDTLLTGDNDGTVVVRKISWWANTPRLELTDSFSARGVQAKAIAPHPREDRFAVATRQPVVRLWTPERRDHPDAGLDDRVNTVAWSSRGALAAGNTGGQLMSAPAGVAGLPVWSEYAVSAHEGDLRTVAWSPDGRQLLSAGDDGRLLLWDTERHEVVRVPARKLAYPGAVAWSADGHWVAAGDGTDVLLWRTASWQPAETVPVGAGANALAFAPDGSLLTVATTSRELRVVRLDLAGRPTGTVDEWEGHVSSISGVSWSPDGRQLATGGYDGHTVLWDPATGQPRRMLEGDGSAVWSVALSRDGSHLVAVTMEGSALLWDTASEAEPCRLRVDNHLSSCAFHPHDDRVVLGGSAGLYLCEISRQSDGSAQRSLREPGR